VVNSHKDGNTRPDGSSNHMLRSQPGKQPHQDCIPHECVCHDDCAGPEEEVHWTPMVSTASNITQPMLVADRRPHQGRVQWSEIRTLQRTSRDTTELAQRTPRPMMTARMV